MQIHELNNRKNAAPLNEVDLVGPNSILNVGKELGKQVLKDPRSLINPVAIGKAKQNAAQTSAAASAKELANPGFFRGTTQGNQAYTVGAQAAPASGQTNAATQQLIKNLAAQWKQLAKGVAAKIKVTPVTEAPATIVNPEITRNPKLGVLYTQQASLAPQTSGYSKTSYNVPTADQAAAQKIDQSVKDATNQKIDKFSREFQSWAEPKLRSLGVDYNRIMSDAKVADAVKRILANLGTESLINPESDEANNLVEQFFEVIITTNQAQQQAAQRGAATAGATSTGGTAAAAPDTTKDLEVLKKYGVTLPQTQLDSLSQGMQRAADGGKVIRNTGNELLNSLARLAGFQVAAT